jgi:hypothetical protein
MKRKRKKSSPIHVVSHGLFTVFGITINFNAVLTAVVTSISWVLISWVIHTVGTNAKYIQSIPKLQADMESVKKEQTRLRKEYLPPVSPTPVESSQP